MLISDIAVLPVLGFWEVVVEMFSGLPELLKMVVVLVLTLFAVLGPLHGWYTKKLLRERLKLAHGQIEKDLERIESQLHDATVQRERATKDKDHTAAENQSLQLRCEQLRNELGQIREEASDLQEELAGLERCVDEAIRIENLWERTAGGAPPFVQRNGSRRPYIISMINLKGGVGKTTLAANLGVTLALEGYAQRPLRILLVDLDFQGTLTSVCVDPQLAAGYSRGEVTAVRLLAAETTASGVDGLTADMVGVPSVRVIIADDRLQRADAKQQALYENHEDDLTLDQAVEMLRKDLATKGTPTERPADPLHDRNFVEALNAAHRRAPTVWE